MVDGGRAVGVSGTRIPINVVATAISGVAATVTVIGTVANALNRWSGTITSNPSFVNRAVGVGVPGAFMLKVTALGSNLEWPPALVDCASKDVFNFPLPTLTPKAADVKWDISEQHPQGLVVRTSDTGPLDDHGAAQLNFETTPETPEEAAGEWAIPGVVNAVATVHRKDLENLQTEMMNRIVRSLPPAIRDIANREVRSRVEAEINKVTDQIKTLQDIEVNGVLLVRYHEPKEPPSGGKRLPLPDACSLVTQAQASAAAGTATSPGVHAPPVDILGLGSSTPCVFQDPSYPRAFVRLDVVDVTGDAAARFAAAEAGSGIKSGEVAGLGDDNFYWVGPDDQALVYVRKANIVFVLAVLLPGTSGNAIQLAKTVVGRI